MPYDPDTDPKMKRVVCSWCKIPFWIPRHCDSYYRDKVTKEPVCSTCERKDYMGVLAVERPELRIRRMDAYDFVRWFDDHA